MAKLKQKIVKKQAPINRNIAGTSSGSGNFQDVNGNYHQTQAEADAASQPVTTPKISNADSGISTSSSGGQDTPTYTPSKIQYGDNSNLPKMTKQKIAGQNTTPGVLLSSGELKTNNWATSFDGQLLFGQKAKQYESKNLGYLDKRNDYLAQDFFSNNPTVTQDQLQSKVAEYLQSKGIEGDQSDIQNTIQKISNRIKGLPLTTKLDTDLADLESKYTLERDDLIKQGAIEDRYTNFNQVNDEVNNVLKIGGEDRAAKGYSGMPSDTDLQEIADKAGVSFDRAKRIMEGFGYETLEMQPEYKKEFETDYTRNIEDLTKQKERQMKDLDTKMAQTRQQVQWQQQDLLRQGQEMTQAMQKLGALRGYANTTAFTDSITAVHEDVLRTVSRLETQLQNAQNATDEDKARLLEDYNTNLARAKEDLDLKARDLNQQVGSTYNTILQNYGGEALRLKLKDLNNNLMDAKIGLINEYISTVGNLNRTKNDEIDNMIQYDNYSAGTQQEVYTKLTANDGEILQSHSIADLQELYKGGHISLDMLKELQTSMLSKAQATLDSLGTPIQSDYTKLSKLMAGGATPEEAINDVVLGGGSRYKDAKADLTGESVSTESLDAGIQAIEEMQVGATYERGGECRMIVNDYVKAIGGKARFGDSLASKMKNKNSDTPTVGSIAIMNSTSKPGNGHVAIVTSVSADGKTMTIKGSNFHKDGKISEDTVSTNVLGFYDPNKPAEKIADTTTTPPPQETEALNNYVDLIIGREVTKSDLNSEKAKDAFGTKGLTSVQAQKKIIGATLKAHGNSVDSYEALYTIYGDTPETKGTIAGIIGKEYGSNAAIKYLVNEMKVTGSTTATQISSAKTLLKNLSPYIKGKKMSENAQDNLKKMLIDAGYSDKNATVLVEKIMTLSSTT